MPEVWLGFLDLRNSCHTWWRIRCVPCSAPQASDCCLPNFLCMMENREQMCHLLLWRLGDKMRRHENMDGPSMGSPTETKTEPLQCIKLLPVQKQYYIVSGGSLLLLRLISDSVGAVLSERTRLAVMISDRSRDPYTPGECTSRTNVSGVLSKARGEADPGWEKVILKITLRGPERTSQIRPNVNVPADYSADNKGSATSSTKGLLGSGKNKAVNAACLLGVLPEAAGCDQSRKEAAALSPAPETLGTWSSGRT